MTNLNESQNPGIVEVIWVDSVILNSGRWTDLDEIRSNLKEEALLHKTVGYLVGESDYAIAVGHSINAQFDIPTDSVAGGIVIPKNAIKETKVLRKK